MSVSPKRVHLTRLLSIWRSAGWPSRDAIEIDVIAAGWVSVSTSASGHETLRVTETGIAVLAESRQRNRRALSLHDRIAEKMAQHLMSLGRVVWRELPLLAKRTTGEASAEKASAAPPAWRHARPDVFSIRNTSAEPWLQPMVHEVKASRADLLSDLRDAAKRESYQGLSCETFYVFPAGIAEPLEIPEPFGIWLVHGLAHGPIEDAQLELVRPAHHTPCTLPFAVWMALAKAAPLRPDTEPAQAELAVTDSVPAG